MPASMPSATLGWNVTDTATTGSPVVEPDNTFKGAGYQPGAKAFAQFFNWWANLDTGWQAYLRDFAIQAHTWTVGQLTDTGADTNVDWSSSTTPTVRKCWLSLPIGTGRKVRLYHSLNHGWELAVNAAWVPGSTLWQLDLSGNDAAILRLSVTGGLKLEWKASGSGAWADNAWDGAGATTIFAGGLKLGASMVATAVLAALPRLTAIRAANGTSARTSIWDLWDPTGSGHGVHIYRSNADTEAFEIVFNAHWSAAGVWVLDSTGEATMLAFSRKRLAVYRKVSDSGGVTFTDDATGWGLGNYPAMQIYWANDLTSSSAFTDTLFYGVLPKAIATLVFNGSGGAPTLDPEAGINVASISIPSADTVRVTFAKAFALANFAAVIKPGIMTTAKIGTTDARNGVIEARVVAQAVNSIDFQLWGAVGDGTNTPLKTGPVNISTGGAGNLYTGLVTLLAFGAQ